MEDGEIKAVAVSSNNTSTAVNHHGNLGPGARELAPELPTSEAGLEASWARVLNDSGIDIAF